MRKKTTGRFDTRTALEEFVRTEYKHTSRNLTQIAKAAGISITTVNNIIEHGGKQQTLKVIANDVIRQIIEDAHQAGQADAGVDPSYSSARAYCDGMFPDA